MGKITFIIGGARSGKSGYAAGLAESIKGKVAFIATCQPLDDEMKKRITQHRKNRPANWQTFEAWTGLASVLKKVSGGFDCVLIDCLTLFVSNLLVNGRCEKEVSAQIKQALAVLKKQKGAAIIVSNEVGLGIVPLNKLARDFRDIAGRINQIVAKSADEVIFMAAG
ncbi:MAG: bifunctional adenosylcobinamide kinase/adenosylcobinamide-phosphate guanylyltransferase, partial [bacterium]|nr:bifunctional adenosylcobinamide kinase/adenosylcobinamide-phosphate guanylyltransferase [bacterium]